MTSKPPFRLWHVRSWPTYCSFPPYLDLVSFGFVLVNFTQVLFEDLSLFVQSRVVLHLFILPRIPLISNVWSTAIPDTTYKPNTPLSIHFFSTWNWINIICNYRLLFSGDPPAQWNYPIVLPSLSSPPCERGIVLWCWRKHYTQHRVKTLHMQK